METGGRTFATKQDGQHRPSYRQPSTLKSTAYSTPLLETPGLERAKTRNDLSAVQPSKATFVPHQGRIHVMVQVPRDYDKLLVSMKTRTHKWQDSTTKEFREIDEYRPSMTKERISTWPEYKKIRVHLIYAVKHDARHVSWQEDTSLKHRLCVLISHLRGIRIVTFLSELNGWNVEY
jgi:hypothetical protein